MPGANRHTMPGHVWHITHWIKGAEHLKALDHPLNALIRYHAPASLISQQRLNSRDKNSLLITTLKR
jgi:hypothetical protein